MRSVLVLFTCFLALSLFAPTCPANAQSQSGQAETSPARPSPRAERGLNFSVGPRGLASLSFNGQSLLVSPESGELQPQQSVFRAVLDALLARSSSRVATPNKQADTIDLSYPWGRISCAYGKQDDRITMRIEVSNTTSEPLGEFSVRLMELTFPRVPDGGIVGLLRFPRLPIHGLSSPLFARILGPARSIFAAMTLNLPWAYRTRQIRRIVPAIRW